MTAFGVGPRAVELSKTPAAGHRRALHLWKSLCGQTKCQRLAALFDYVPPQPLWNPLGEHLGGGKRERKEREEKEHEE